MLRYSQVSAYNALVEAILTLKDTVTIEVGHGDKKRCLLVTTLQKILKDAIDIAKTKNNLTMIAENQKLLDELPRFSKNWLEDYQEAGRNALACRQV